MCNYEVGLEVLFLDRAYSVYASSTETLLRLHKLVWAVSARVCNKYQILVC